MGPQLGTQAQYAIDVLKALQEADRKAAKLTDKARQAALIRETLRDLAEKYINGNWRK